MMHMGLQLLTVALESGHIANYQSLLVLVKDELCRHLFQVCGRHTSHTFFIGCSSRLRAKMLLVSFLLL